MINPLTLFCGVMYCTNWMLHAKALPFIYSLLHVNVETVSPLGQGLAVFLEKKKLIVIIYEIFLPHYRVR